MNCASESSCETKSPDQQQQQKLPRTGPLTRFSGSPWAVFEGLAFLVFAAGMTLATAYLTHVDVWYKPGIGWGETVSYPNVFPWITLPCYAIGWALLASWWWERRRQRRKQASV